MARLVVEEQKEIPLLPVDSIIELIVEKVEERTVQGPRGDWTKFEYTFKIIGIQSTPGSHPSEFDGLVGEKIFGSTSTKLTEGSENRLRQWAEAILARPLGLGDELDTDWFLRRQVRGVTKQYTTKQGWDRHEVTSLLPMGGGAGVVPGQAPGAQQAPVQQAPTGWGAPQQAPQDPWSQPQQQAPAANDPWGQPQYQQPAPQQQYQQAPQQAPQPQYQGAQQAFEEEPPF